MVLSKDGNHHWVIHDVAGVVGPALKVCCFIDAGILFQVYVAGFQGVYERV